MRGIGDLPVLDWLAGYAPRRFRLDAIAGLSLAAFAIPESLAYASLAGLPPVSGLYCYLVAGLAYALIGSSRQAAIGPTSAMSIAVAAGIGALAAGDPGRAVALASGIALVVGIICIVGRFVGLANLAYFLSDAVVAGFKTGAALYIASTQLPKLLGLEGGHGNFFERLVEVAHGLPDASWPSFAVGAAAIVLFLALERALPGRPTTLIVVGAAIALASVFDPGRYGVKLVGELPQGLPMPALPDLSADDLVALLPTAFACFLLAYSEAISVARTFAQKNGYDIDPERELLAVGASNLATSMVRGFPVTGGMSQSAVNDMGGATSPMSLIVTSGAVALTLLFLAGLFRHLPEPILGAIVLMAAKHLVKVEDLRELRRASRMEFHLALIALVGVLLFGLLQGLLLAAVGCIIALVARASHPVVAVLARDPASGRYINHARLAEVAGRSSVLVLRTAGGWLYFNVDQINRRLLELLAAAGRPIDAVVLDFSMVPTMDLTATAGLRSLARSLARRGIALHLAELRDDLREDLQARGAEADLGTLVSHRTVEQAVAAAQGQAGYSGSQSSENPTA
ncbi:SulP family inorganic anion transporter [Reyranella soli]|nr:SulP family inorganic anion transporter [Reyranella soli]